VLEHVPEPNLVLEEFHRILKSGGHIFITTPFMHPLHEEPYDFYRYTPYALKTLVESAGFEVMFITPRGGWIVSIASTLRRYTLKPTRNMRRLLLYALIFLPIFFLPMLLIHLLPMQFLAWLDKRLDTHQTWTLGYALHARKRED
jgi:SAM-dependent methyltransferase